MNMPSLIRFALRNVWNEHSWERRNTQLSASDNNSHDITQSYLQCRFLKALNTLPYIEHRGGRRGGGGWYTQNRVRQMHIYHKPWQKDTFVRDPPLLRPSPPNPEPTPWRPPSLYFDVFGWLLIRSFTVLSWFCEKTGYSVCCCCCALLSTLLVRLLWLFTSSQPPEKTDNINSLRGWIFFFNSIKPKPLLKGERTITVLQCAHHFVETLRVWRKKKKKHVRRSSSSRWKGYCTVDRGDRLA